MPGGVEKEVRREEREKGSGRRVEWEDRSMSPVDRSK